MFLWQHFWGTKWLLFKHMHAHHSFLVVLQLSLRWCSQGRCLNEAKVWFINAVFCGNVTDVTKTSFPTEKLLSQGHLARPFRFLPKGCFVSQRDMRPAASLSGPQGLLKRGKSLRGFILRTEFEPCTSIRTPRIRNTELKGSQELLLLSYPDSRHIHYICHS